MYSIATLWAEMIVGGIHTSEDDPACSWSVAEEGEVHKSWSSERNAQGDGWEFWGRIQQPCTLLSFNGWWVQRYIKPAACSYRDKMGRRSIITSWGISWSLCGTIHWLLNARVYHQRYTSLHEFSLTKLRGQCYDGASNMRGARNGVAKQLQDVEPRAIYLH